MCHLPSRIKREVNRPYASSLRSTNVAVVGYLATQLIAEGKDIIAVLHPFGGIVGTEALQ